MSLTCASRLCPRARGGLGYPGVASPPSTTAPLLTARAWGSGRFYFMGFFVGILFSERAWWPRRLEPLGFKGGGGLSPGWDARSQEGLPDETLTRGLREEEGKEGGVSR